MQQPVTFVMRGGLDLVTPPIAMDPGTCAGALNYEPDAAGYRRMDDYVSVGEEVPGKGPIRGIWVYDNAVWAFRDTDLNGGGMYRLTNGAWVKQNFGGLVYWRNGTAAFQEGDTVTGALSSVSRRIVRAVQQGGQYGEGNAFGYLVLDSVGDFTPNETITGLVGSASATSSVQIGLATGGRYQFANHNFRGLVQQERMYFCNGVQDAFEWDGTDLIPLIVPVGEDASAPPRLVKARSGGTVLTRGGGRVILRRDVARPRYVSEAGNHLFLAFRAGTVLHSSIGDPTDWRMSTGAGEIAVRGEPTGFIRGSSGALVILSRNRVSYLTGTSAADFVLQVLSDGTGGIPHTQGTADAPYYMDQGGIRRLETTSAFGNFRVGTITERVEPLLAALRQADIQPVAAVVVRRKDQYRLFYETGFGLFIYFGARKPEIMPFQMPFGVTDAVTGQMGGRERTFVAGTDGRVYEMDLQTGGKAVAFVRMAWNSARAPHQRKRFHSLRIEMQAPDGAEVLMGAEADYGATDSTQGAFPEVLTAEDGREMMIDDILALATEVAGGLTVTTQDRADSWASIGRQVVEHGVVQAQLSMLGRNIAVVVMSEDPHTLTAGTVFLSQRGLQR